VPSGEKVDNGEQSSNRCRGGGWLRVLKRGFGALGILVMLVVVGFGLYYTSQTIKSRRSFYKSWQPAAGGSAISREDAMSGSWTGAWKSLGMKDGGNIKCIITATNGTGYHARFLSGHYGAFESEDLVVFSPTNVAGKKLLEGSTDLSVEGIYTYKGYADGTNLFLEWSCALDHGNLTLWRIDESRSPGKDRVAAVGRIGLVPWRRK
jgi:hypothetical protein